MRERTGYRVRIAAAALIAAAVLAAPRTLTGDVINIEAESGVYTSPSLKTGGDSTASGNVYLRTAIPATAQLTLTFQITAPGNYAFQARAQAPTAGNDKWYVSIDGATEFIWDSVQVAGYNWEWNRIGVSAWNLLAGQHTIVFRGLDQNARIDAIKIEGGGSGPGPSTGDGVPGPSCAEEFGFEACRGPQGIPGPPGPAGPSCVDQYGLELCQGPPGPPGPAGGGPSDVTALTAILCRHLSGDAGNPPSDAIAVCGDQLSKTVFTTSHYYDGDLKTAGGGATGLEGADNICNATARGAGLAGTYTAWLSDSITGARDRVTHSNVPYKRTDGALIANNFADLTDGVLVNPLEYNEFGILIGYGHAWTNTRQDGLRFKLNDPSLTCNDWTNNTIDGQPVVGHLDDFVSGNWTLAETGFPCSSQEVRLYCFQD